MDKVHSKNRCLYHLIIISVLAALLHSCKSQYKHITKKEARQLEKLDFSRDRIQAIDSFRSHRDSCASYESYLIDSLIRTTNLNSLPCDTQEMNLSFGVRHPWQNNNASRCFPELTLYAYCYESDSFQTFKVIKSNYRLSFTDTTGKPLQVQGYQNGPFDLKIISSLLLSADPNESVEIAFINLIAQDPSLKTFRLRRRILILNEP